MKFPNQSNAFLVGLVGILISVSSALGRPSLEFMFGGDESIPAGSIGILVADRAANGFQSLDHVSVVGTALSAEESIGLSDDLIVGVFHASSAGFEVGNGFADFIPNIDVDRLQLEHSPLAFYWFPEISEKGQRLVENDSYFRYESSGSATDEFRSPRRGIAHILYLTTSNGGGVRLDDDAEYGIVGKINRNQGGNRSIDIPDTPFEDITLNDVGFSDNLRGRYVGLVQGPDNRIAGEVRVTVGKSGAASFYVLINGRAQKLKGNFDPETGEFAELVIGGITYRFQLNKSQSGEYLLTGTAIKMGDEFLIGAIQQPADGEFDAEKLAGRYTMLLPGPQAGHQSFLPDGNGYATITVSAKGGVKASLMLGDGTTATDSTFVGGGGSWQLFLPLYTKGGNGFLAGELRFRDENNVSDVDGELHWKKQPRQSDARYPLGFETSVYAVGCKYYAPWAGELALSQLAREENNASWKYDTDTFGAVSQTFTWAVGNKLLKPTEAITTAFPTVSATDVKLNLKQSFSTKTGKVNGTIIIPARQGRPESAKFYGVALQKQGVVAGVIQRKNHTQYFVIEPIGGPSLTVADAGGNPLADGDTVDFGDIGMDGGIGERVLEIGNVGNANLYLGEDPAITPESYSLAAWRRGYLAPGESAIIRIQVDPDSIGAVPGELTISSNDPANNPLKLTLTTNGVAGAQSNIDTETGGNSTLTMPTEFEAAEFSDADFLAENDAGRYGGAVLNVGGGNASLLISKTGAFSGRVTIGANYAIIRGTIGADGIGTATYFKGRLAATHQVAAVELLENPDGANAILINLQSDVGDEAVLLRHQNFGKANRTEKAGRYTFVLPNAENLGVGYPSGDGAGVMTIDSYGIVRAKLRLADRQVRALSGRLASDESWSFSQRWTLGILTGKIHFTESAEADFQGGVSYQRLAHPRVTIFPRGFAIQNPILGSRFVAEKGASLLVLPARSGNALLNLAGDLSNPIAGMPIDWTPNGRIVLETRVSGETVRMTVNRKSGWVVGKSSIQGEKTGFSGVAFQKQNVVAGSWGSGNEVGAFSITEALGSE